MGGQRSVMAAMNAEGGDITQADFSYLLYILAEYVGRDGMGSARSSSGRSSRQGHAQHFVGHDRQLPRMCSMRVCVHVVCVCACRKSMACGVSVHGRKAWSEAWSHQPTAQDPGMSLCESMYGPHVLVYVRVRGAFQKKEKKP